MSFAQLHDGFYRNSKVRSVGPEAAWMWVASIGYASEGLTDGFISVAALHDLITLDAKPRLKLVAKLVEAGLWEPCEGGWMIHDYLNWNLSRAAILERRAANLARVNKHRTNTVSHTEGNARVMHYNARTSAVSNSPPSVPLNLSTNTNAEDTKTLSPAAVAPSVLPSAATVTTLALDLGEPTTAAPKPAKTKRTPKPADPPPFGIGDAFEALASSAGGRFAAGLAGDWTKGVRIAVAKSARQYPDLAAWRLVGEWLAAGGDRFRGVLGPSWAASTALADAMARAREWDATGRPALAGAPANSGQTLSHGPDAWSSAAKRNGVAL